MNVRYRLLTCTLLATALLGTFAVQAQSTYEPRFFSTFAGQALRSGSADGTGSAALFNAPSGVAVDSAGNVYVADTSNHTIRKITPAGVVTTLAGLAGITGSADGTGSAAQFKQPSGVAVDSAGNVYVADTSNDTIRKITSTGVVTTLAGLAGNFGSADGAGSAARFNVPGGVAVDSAGNVYVADTFNFTIRKITSAGVVTTLAGLARTSGSADGTGSAALFNFPSGVAVDSAGNVYVADNSNNTIRKITPAGVVTTLAGLAGSRGSADGTRSAALFNDPEGVAVDSAGNVYVGDTLNNTIRKITSAGVVTTLAGLAGSIGSADGTGSAARFYFPHGVAVDTAGNVYVGDVNNFTIRVSGPPVITSPLTATATVGQRFVYQFETQGATSLAVSALPSGLTFNTNLAAIIGTPTTSGTFQVGLSAINAAGTRNATLTLAVQPAKAISIASSSSVTGRTGQPFSFQVISRGATTAANLDPGILPAELFLDPVTGIISGIPLADGSFSVTLTLTEGNLTTSSTLQLTFVSDPAFPVIVSPASVTVAPGQTFTYTILAPGSSDPNDPTTYALIGTLPPGLTFDDKTGTISGVYNGNPIRDDTPPGQKYLSGGIITNVQLFAKNSHGIATAPLNFFSPPPGAVNISTRLAIGTGEDVLIAGFIITGNAPKKVIIRGIGPSLNSGGIPVPGRLLDPVLELHGGDGTLLQNNDDWRSFQENEIVATGIAPSDDLESAMIATLQQNSNYTAIVSGNGGTTGIGLVEVYDLGTASFDTSGKARLAQISTRGTVQRGDNVMIGGFIISGVATKVIVRAIGPELTTVAGALQDTMLELRDGSGALIMSNDDWRTGQEQQIIDTTVPPKDDRESAIVANLVPGAYTAIVRGKVSTTGVALVEVYALQ